MPPRWGAIPKGRWPFSWWMTKLLHRFPDTDPYELRIQRAEIEHLATVESAQETMAINYVGLPY